MEKEYLEQAKKLVDFIAASPTAYHAVREAEKMLTEKGFIELEEDKSFEIERGRSYYLKRSQSALIAFCVPEEPEFFNIVASHTDSPCFKVKWNPEVRNKDLPTRLNTEVYGSLLAYTWFDRPLSLAGRVFYREEGEIVERLVDFKNNLNLVIPSLAIHQNREANNGWKISMQKEMLPLLGDGDEDLLSIVAYECNTKVTDILDYDLYLYNNTPPVFSGAESEYFSSPRIDDLECAYSSLVSLLASKSKKAISMITLFDNEETGSGTRQGALSDFLVETIERISSSLKWSEEKRYIAKAKSFMLSADNGHAVHPAFPEKSDITNKPRMNGGVLIKYAASQKYTTNGESGALTKSLLEKNGISYQIFFNNSDIAGGSTLGNLSTQKISIRTCDCGLAQLAMHSSYETAGVKDVTSLIAFFRAFLSL